MKDLTHGNETDQNGNSVVKFPGHQKNSMGQYVEYHPIESTYVEEGDINLRDLWHVLLRRRWVVLVFFLISIVSTLIATFLVTPVYRSSLTLQVDRVTPKVLEFQAATPDEHAFDNEFYQTQLELLKSRSLAQRVISQLSLESHPVFIGKTKTVQNESGLVNQIKTNDQRNRLIERFLGSLSVEPVKRSRLIKIHYESPDPDLSAKIANTIAKNFINMTLERRFDASSYAKTFIEDRLRQIKANLEDSERELIKFARENEIINIENNQPIIVKQLQQVNTTLAKTEEKRIKAEALYQEMLETKGQGINEILNNTVIQSLKQLKTEIESEYQDKLKLYKPAYPAMLQLKGRIEEVQKKINIEIVNIRNAVYTNYKAQKREEDILLGRLSDLKEQVLELQDRSIQYKVLKRETDTNKQLYQGLLQRMKEVGVAGGISTNNISIIDKAEVPISKYKPRLSLNLLLALVFGLFGGVFLAFFFDYFDDTIKLPEDIEKLSHLPVLGLVPVCKQQNITPSEIDKFVGLSSHHDPRSAIAEAYRSTRTALQFSTPTGAPSILLITSASPGEGKTTSAINVATTFSQMGKKVLLVDTDLRNPSIHQILNIPNITGLTNYLAGTSKPVDISTHTCVPGLFAIASGPLPPNPAELLTSSKMTALLDQAKERFDFVVLDGPPVMGLADALVLANISDGTVLVVESGTTRNEHMQAAIKRLKTTTANLIGVILSKYTTHHGAYDYYNTYYSYHRENLGKLPSGTEDSETVNRKSISS